MIVFGKRNFGTTHEVPGVFHVTTNFFHIDFVPLCPIASYLIIDRAISSRRGNLGFAIPLNKKSMLLAYGLGAAWASFLISMICLIFFLNTYFPNKQAVLLSSLCLVGSLLLALFLYFSKMTRKATYEEAMELCSYVNASARPLIEQAINAKFNRLVAIPSTPLVAISGTPVVDATVVGNNDNNTANNTIQLAKCVNENTPEVV